MIDQQAHEAATSPYNSLRLPTEAQKDAGNYKVGKIKVHGIDISIENPVGSTRYGVDTDGKAWATKMQDHYGYLRGTVGADDSHIDVFVGKNTGSNKVFIIDQTDPKTGNFDEHKCMIGYNSLMQAKAAYQANYSKDWQGGKNVAQTTIAGFKAWLKSGDTKLPFAGSKPGLIKMQQAKAART